MILSLPIWALNQVGPIYEARVEKPVTSRDEMVPILLGQFFEFNEECRSWLPEIFWKEIRSNGELIIILLILASYLTQRMTSGINGKQKFGYSGESEKGKQYFGRVLLLHSVSSHIWANYLL